MRSYKALGLILFALLLAGPPALANTVFFAKQSTAYTFVLPDLVASSDHIAGLTGATGTVRLVKVNTSSGSASAAASTNSVSELDSTNNPGQYSLTLTTTETNTLGFIKGYWKPTGADPCSFTVVVVGHDPFDSVRLGLSALPNAAAGANGGLPTGNGSGQVTVAGTASGAITSSSFGAAAIDAAAIAPDAIGASEIAADAIGSSEVAADALGASEIAADAVGSSELAGTGANEVRDSILSDSTPFAGGNVNATISSRSSHSAADVWTSGTRSLTDKAGFSLANLDSPVLHSGTAQAGASGSITLATGASATTDFYVYNVVKIYSGTGAGQARIVTAYNGTTKVATVNRNWAVNPDSTSLYAVLSLEAVKTDSNGAVTAGTVSDKTGYSLTQAFPSNFSALAITGGGAVTAGTVSDKTGYTLTQSFPTNFASLSINGSGLVDLTQTAADKVWGSATRTLTGAVTLDLTQALNTSNTGDTVGGGLLAARAQGFGRWVLSGTTLTLYAANGTTVVRTFTLDSSSAPTQRQ